MAGQTKMIIITSNEDIIRQFSLNKTIQTYMIDLDNDKQLISNTKDNQSIINLSVVSSLSTNSNNDQLSKRTLDSSDQNQSKPIKTKKSADMICTICGDQAIGFNYDVLSCASCKAFFRRNANQNTDKLRCLKGQGQCSVAHETKRKCPKCRLERCFSAGMRKDFIQTEEEKQRRRVRLEENRNLTSKRLSTSESTTNLSPTSNSLSTSESSSSMLDELDYLLMDTNQVNDDLIINEEDTQLIKIEQNLFGTLCVEDWVTIQNVQSSFMTSFQVPADCRNALDVSNRTTAIISWSEFASQIALRFISFFRQIREFEGLHADDRFTLIKYNLLTVFPISKCYHYKQHGDCCSHDWNEAAEKSRQFFSLMGAPVSIRDKFIKLIVSLVEITEQDPTILSLLLTILILSPGLSMSVEEPPLKDPLAVNQAQSHYIKILWNYLVNQGGEIKACKRFTQLLTLILRIQSTSKTSRDTFRKEFISPDVVDKIGPLMQTFLHIS